MRIIALTSVEDIGRLDSTCHTFHSASETGRPSAVEEALRLRAHASAHTVPHVLPEGWSSWTQMLCWEERRHRFVEPPIAAGGMYHSLLIEGGGRLLTCGSATLDGGRPCAPHTRRAMTGALEPPRAPTD